MYHWSFLERDAGVVDITIQVFPIAILANYEPLKLPLKGKTGAEMTFWEQIFPYFCILSKTRSQVRDFYVGWGLKGPFHTAIFPQSQIFKRVLLCPYLRNKEGWLLEFAIESQMLPCFFNLSSELVLKKNCICGLWSAGKCHKLKALYIRLLCLQFLTRSYFKGWYKDMGGLKDGFHEIGRGWGGFLKGWYKDKAGLQNSFHEMGTGEGMRR